MEAPNRRWHTRSSELYPDVGHVWSLGKFDGLNAGESLDRVRIVLDEID